MKPAKKIDIHTHVTHWPELVPQRPNGGKRFLTAQEQIAMWDEINVQHGVLLPLPCAESQWETISNEETCMIARAHPDKFSWFCNVDPRAGNNRPDTDLGYLLEHYKSLGAKGLGELTSNLYADDPRMDNLFGCCAALDMPVLIHIAPERVGFYGIVDDPGLPRIEKMLKKHPDLKLIGHSQPFWAEIGCYEPDQRNRYPKGKVTEGRLPKLMREYGNLRCDLSAGSGANAIMRDREFGIAFLTEFADRIYFGCDICSDRDAHQVKFSNYLQELADSGELPTHVYEKICWSNAAALLDL